MEDDDNDETGSSFVVVSDDNLSKKIKIFKNTNFSDFYQKILEYFPRAFNYIKRLFYFEAYSHEKRIITNEEEYIIANKKCIEFFYFCANYSNNCLMNDDMENTDYLKYHSVILFTPIKIVNTEEQKNAKKKMKIIIKKNTNNYNNNNNQINNSNINQMDMNNNNLSNNYYYNQNFNNMYMYNPMNNMNYNMMGMNYPMNNLNLNNQMNYMNQPMAYNNIYYGNMNYMNRNNMFNPINPMMMNNNNMINNNMNPMVINNNNMMINNNNMINNNMNPMMINNHNMIMNNRNMMINNNNMNPMMINNNMNPIINNYQYPMINNGMNNQMMNNMNYINNPVMNNNFNKINYCNYNLPMNNDISKQTLSLFFQNLKSNNSYQALLMMRQMNPVKLNNILENFMKNANMKNINTNNNINNVNNNISAENENGTINENSEALLDYDILDTETNPMNKFIENAINISYTMKQQILKLKSLNPDMFINITNTLSTPGLLADVQANEDYKYILCLIGKILENNGITVGIYKENNIKDRIDLAAIQFIFSGLISKKKYKIQFNFTENEILCIKHNTDEFKKQLIRKWKVIISNKLSVSRKLVILTNLREEGNKYYFDLAFNPEINNINTSDENSIRQKLIGGQIQDCKLVPLLEGCTLSSNIFAANYNKIYSKNNNNNNNNNNNIQIQNNQKRGKEDYIPPYEWAAYGINISGKYDFGDNTWLGNNNEEGEFAVAYYGINNLFHHNIQMIQNIMSFMGNLESGKTFMDEINIRKPGEKCMSGAYFYKNPEIAENSSEIINIGGFDYKIMFMCRINPKKIRQPENFPELWILSPTPDEIRPYKILIKKIAKSSLANASQQNIKMAFNAPPATYMQILQQKDESYFSNNNTGGSNLDYVLKQYTGSMYSYVNNYLRDGTINNNNAKDANSTVWCLHKAITQNNPNVQNGALLYRGVCKKLPNNIVVGTRFFFPEFISTSKDINVAKSFGGSGTLMYITVQNNGTNGKKVYCRDVSGISIFPEEQEIIFTSYCRFRVTKVEKSEGWDILHLVCEGHYF